MDTLTFQLSLNVMCAFTVRIPDVNSIEGPVPTEHKIYQIMQSKMTDCLANIWSKLYSINQLRNILGYRLAFSIIQKYFPKDCRLEETLFTMQKCIFWGGMGGVYLCCSNTKSKSLQSATWQFNPSLALSGETVLGQWSHFWHRQQSNQLAHQMDTGPGDMSCPKSTPTLHIQE